MRTGVPLCQWHLDQLAREFAQPDRVFVPIDRDSPAVVYYVGHSESQTIKIGTSMRPDVRVKALEARKGKLVVLGVEPGHYDLERVRHRMFSHLRIDQRGQREWYRKAPDLMEHITKVKALHGLPDWAQVSI